MSQVLEQFGRGLADFVDATKWFALAKWIRPVATFLVVTLLTRFGGIEVLGRYEVFLVTVNLMVPISSLNLSEAVYRYYDNKDTPPYNILPYAAIAGVTVAVCTFFCLLVFEKIRVGLVGDVELAGALSLAIVFAVPKEVAKAFFKSGDQYFKLVTTNALEGVVSVVLLGAFALVNPLTTAVAIWTYVAAVVLASCIALWALVKEGMETAVRLDEFIRYVRFSSPLLPNTLMLWTIKFADRILIKVLLGSAATGLYAIAVRGMAVYNLLYGPIYEVFKVRLLREGKGGLKRESKLNAAAIGTSAIVGLALLPVIVFLIYGEWSWYLSGVGAVAMAGTATITYGSFLGIWYLDTEATNRTVLSATLSAGANVGCNIVLIPVAGVWGAAISTLVAGCIFAGVRVVELRAGLV